ncbi:MAG: hypothetical protein ACREVO_09210 [Steroidobacteraceae bacterium]
MNREEFAGYVQSRAEELGIPLHKEGELAGLPREFHQAVAVACLIDALGQPAPSGDALRGWYGLAGAESTEMARWAYRVVRNLRNSDLGKLDVDALLEFWILFDGFGGLAHALANDLRRKSGVVNPSKDGEGWSVGRPDGSP